jgi:uncharacterized protein
MFYYIWLSYEIIFALFFPDFMNYPTLAYKTYPDISPAELTAIFKDGSFMEVLRANWHNLYYRYIDLIPSGRLTKVLALFLLGFYLMSIDYFNKYARSYKLLTLFFVLGIFLTYIAYSIGGSMGKFSHSLTDVSFKFIDASGQIFLALSYISILSILYETKLLKKTLHLFSFVGRMSFTNYLSHTLFGYLIFYPFFGGLFGTMGLLEISILAVVIYSIQIVFSFVWLKFFLYGPLEWAWRCLTNKQLYPIRKSN